MNEQSHYSGVNATRMLTYMLSEIFSVHYSYVRSATA